MNQETKLPSEHPPRQGAIYRPATCPHHRKQQWQGGVWCSDCQTDLELYPPSEPPKDAKGGLPDDTQLNRWRDARPTAAGITWTDGARWVRDIAQPLIDSQAAQIAELGQRLAEVTRERDEVRAQLAPLQSEEFYKTFTELRDKAVGEIVGVVTERDSLRAQLSTREQELAESRAELDRLNSDCAELGRIGLQAQSTAFELEAKLSTLRVETVSRKSVKAAVEFLEKSAAPFDAACSLLRAALQPAPADSAPDTLDEFKDHPIIHKAMSDFEKEIEAPDFTTLGVGDWFENGWEFRYKGNVAWATSRLPDFKISDYDAKVMDFRRPNKKQI